MSEGRALLTDREREAIAGKTSDSYRYKTRSYFRERLEKLQRDIAVLEEHDADLLDELRSVVCEGEHADTRKKPPAEGEEAGLTPPLDPESPPSGTPEEEEPDDPPEIKPDADLVALVEELDLPGGGSKLEKRRNAIAEILTFMRDTGEASREEILAIAERHDYGGYASGASFRSNVWSNHVLPQLKRRGVVESTDTTGVYEFGKLP